MCILLYITPQTMTPTICVKKPTRGPKIQRRRVSVKLNTLRVYECYFQAGGWLCKASSGHSQLNTSLKTLCRLHLRPEETDEQAVGLEVKPVSMERC